MAIGKLRHRIVIQAENGTDDGYGGTTDPWASPTVVATVWASIKPMSAAERLQFQRLEQSVTHKIRIRYRSGVSPSNRIVFGTRLFNIRAVTNPDERNRWLDIIAEEGVAT